GRSPGRRDRTLAVVDCLSFRENGRNFASRQGGGPVNLTPVAGRSAWTCLSDEQLKAQCETDLYRASGPGGQKRNKTSSAVRLRHRPSGLTVIAEESRSQHENRARALRRLRRGPFPVVRPAPTPPQVHPRRAARGARPDGRVRLGVKDERFWPAAGVALDALAATEARVAEAAAALGVSTGNLIDFLHTDPKLWQQANELRTRFGQKPLR